MSLRRVLPPSLSLALFVAAQTHAVEHQQGYLVNNVMLPTSSGQATSYAIDLDGDSNPDNNFGQLLSALAAQGLDFSSSTNAAVSSGSIVHLLSVHSTDPLFLSDPAAEVDWYVGLAAPSPPLFDGTDDLPYNSSIAPGTFLAALSNGTFTSPSPATAASLVDLTLEVQLGASKIDLPVQDAHLSFSLGGGGLMQGQLNGSVLHSDYMTIMPPAFSALCNAYIQSDPTSNNATTCKGIFDKGCSGHSELSGDGMIEVCEVAESPLIQTLLAADLQFNSADANSLGIRFTAIASPDRVFADGFDP